MHRNLFNLIMAGVPNIETFVDSIDAFTADQMQVVSSPTMKQPDVALTASTSSLEMDLSAFFKYFFKVLFENLKGLVVFFLFFSGPPCKVYPMCNAGLDPSGSFPSLNKIAWSNKYLD
jgi:hypothetical protein